jgi:hypothetical protein
MSAMVSFFHPRRGKRGDAYPAPALVGVFDELAYDERGENARRFYPVGSAAVARAGVVDGLAVECVRVLAGAFRFLCFYAGVRSVPHTRQAWTVCPWIPTPSSL